MIHSRPTMFVFIIVFVIGHVCPVIPLSRHDLTHIVCVCIGIALPYCSMPCRIAILSIFVFVAIISLILPLFSTQFLQQIVYHVFFIFTYLISCILLFYPI